MKNISKIILFLFLLFGVPYILDHYLILVNNSSLFTPLNKSQVQVDLANAINKWHFLLSTYIYNFLVGIVDVFGITFWTTYLFKDCVKGIKSKVAVAVFFFCLSCYLNFSSVYHIYITAIDAVNAIILPVN